MAILDVSVVPIGTVGTSLSFYVAECVSILQKEKKIKHELTSMGTNIEGDLKDLMRVVMKMHETPFRKGAKRVLTIIRIDDRRDKKGTMEGKKKAVQRKLRRR
ncbi:MAG: MTH1187 family thiamine-binding protein [Thermodesulfobacteriota bacterium]|nr:MTH1187 family thiamine-binding protein [Thermodesulfobacteriota bacterium]